MPYSNRFESSDRSTLVIVVQGGVIQHITTDIAEGSHGKLLPHIIIVDSDVEGTSESDPRIVEWNDPEAANAYNVYVSEPMVVTDIDHVTEAQRCAIIADEQQLEDFEKMNGKPDPDLQAVLATAAKFPSAAKSGLLPLLPHIESPEVTNRYICYICGNKDHFMGVDHFGYGGNDACSNDRTDCCEAECGCHTTLIQPFTVIHSGDSLGLEAPEIVYQAFKGGESGAEIGSYTQIYCVKCGLDLWTDPQARDSKDSGNREVASNG